jgi:hypothetical protein
MEEKKQRTSQQNRALHLAFRQIADTLTEHGLDVRLTLKDDFEVQWSEALVKELLFRQTMKVLLGKKSTTELTTDEVDIVFNAIRDGIAKHGLELRFPSMETLMEEVK